MRNDSLGDRMKAYESIASQKLMRRVPVILRIDGKAFHSFTRGMQKPYDTILMDAMQNTALRLCKNIQGAKLAYTQSDEISILLTDYDTLQTDSFFGYKVQKICSVVASMATLYFNDEYRKIVEYESDKGIGKLYLQKINTALFDARCFNLPKEDVCNYFIWRQQDATRNAIQMLAQANFAHKELQGKSCNNLQDMLMEQKGINFNDEPTMFKRGSCVKRCDNEERGWCIDLEVPIFTKDREYVERFTRPAEQVEE